MWSNLKKEKLIIGSTAIKNFHSDFRVPKDLDVISKIPVMEKEHQSYWIPEFQELLDLNKNMVFLDPDLCLTLKMSHFLY